VAGTSNSGGAPQPPSGGMSGTGGTGGLAGGMSGVAGVGGASPTDYALGLNMLLMHDECTGVNTVQTDTCLHAQKHEQVVTFGGEASVTYDVVLRVRGLFEPTNISGGKAPLTDHPYFKVGGTVNASDYSQWQIIVEKPAATYYLNHYPQTSHTIYQEDFQAPIVVAGGSKVTVRVSDSNDREIDNGYTGGLADRQQKLEGVTDMVLDGQVLRLDVVSVESQ
jgi:hypothetical protein